MRSATMSQYGLLGGVCCGGCGVPVLGCSVVANSALSSDPIGTKGVFLVEVAPFAIPPLRPQTAHPPPSQGSQNSQLFTWLPHSWLPHPRRAEQAALHH